MVPVPNRSGLRAALESTSGTVTDFLEQLVGERIDAEAHHHETVSAPSPNDLGVPGGEPLLHRAATLRGRASRSPYVYAESVIVTRRLSTSFRLRLETGIDPIGRILDELGISVTREHRSNPRVRGLPAAGAVRIADSLLSRTYRICSEQGPLIVITECS